MEEKPKARKGYHWRKGGWVKNREKYVPLGKRIDNDLKRSAKNFDDSLKKSLKKSGLW